MRIIACIEDPEVIEKIFTHLAVNATEREVCRTPLHRSGARRTTGGA